MHILAQKSILMIGGALHGTNSSSSGTTNQLLWLYLPVFYLCQSRIKSFVCRTFSTYSNLLPTSLSQIDWTDKQVHISKGNLFFEYLIEKL